ncbi:MAG TPA: nicotinamide-nucleotide amidohydrolase family protein [Acidiferrobacteraceae bacterium]|nr:nicotinamide-nucleotide amidohydrolase family protein [Acidiferrobacteraceae bacterium]
MQAPKLGTLGWARSPTGRLSKRVSVPVQEQGKNKEALDKKVELVGLIQQIGALMVSRQWLLATAESCTGGGIAQAVTNVAGSSQWFDCGFVTYSNAAKQGMLGVSAQTLAEQGAVSEATVIAMALGALHKSQAHVAVAVSGIAGPGGGTPAKPVGTVWFAWAVKDAAVDSGQQRFQGNRLAVREQAVGHALQGILAHLEQAAN